MKLFAEMKLSDPVRYADLEQKAREEGLITDTQSLADLDVDPTQDWLWAYFVHKAEGGTLSPGQFMTAQSIAGYANRRRMAGTGTVWPAPMTPEKEEKSKATFGTMTENAKKNRHDHAASTTGRSTTPEEKERQRLAMGIAGYANRRRMAGTNTGEVSSATPISQNRSNPTPEQLEAAASITAYINEYREEKRRNR